MLKKDDPRQPMVETIAAETRRVARALKELGYYLIKLDIEQTGSACRKIVPDMHLWIRQRYDDDQDD
jgi:hypothetical protein